MNIRTALVTHKAQRMHAQCWEHNRLFFEGIAQSKPHAKGFIQIQTVSLQSFTCALPRSILHCFQHILPVTSPTSWAFGGNARSNIFEKFNESYISYLKPSSTVPIQVTSYTPIPNREKNGRQALEAVVLNLFLTTHQLVFLLLLRTTCSGTNKFVEIYL